MDNLKQGDYVIATKWQDGDPGDQWCVGFFDEKYDHFGHDRYMVVDSEGNQFRFNGFRRIKKISKDRGKWILDHIDDIKYSGRSLWFWVRCPMKTKDLI